MTASKGLPRHSRRIARYSFDPDAMAQQCARDMVLSNAWAELNGLGVRFLSSMRSISVRELWHGAAKEAESDEQIGWLLRRAMLEGFFSESPQVLGALEKRGFKERNTERRKQLRNARNTRPGREFAAAIADHIDKSQSVLELQAAGSALIDRDVRATPGYRDLAVDWPHRLVGNVAVPINDPHKRS